MRDQNARKSILLLNFRLQKVEQLLLDFSNNIQMANTTPLSGTCLKCGINYYEGMICQDNLCPHGLDVNEEL